MQVVAQKLIKVTCPLSAWLGSVVPSSSKYGVCGASLRPEQADRPKDDNPNQVAALKQAWRRAVFNGEGEVMWSVTTMKVIESMRTLEVPAKHAVLCARPNHGRVFWGLCVALLIGACSPSYNWRTWTASGAPWEAMIPCKPDVAQREFNLGGANAELHLHSCDNQGLRFALAWVAVPPTVDAQRVMDQWQKASAQSLQSDKPPQPLALPAVRGAQHTAWWSAQGRDHRGQSVSSQAVYFTDGQRVYQAAIYGHSWQPGPVAPFWEGLKLP